MRGRVRRTAGRTVAALAAFALACAPDSRPPSVLLIVVDTLRADALGCYGAAGEPTPAIDRLADQGTRFLTARTQSSWTLPSAATILTGLYPTEHGATGLGNAVSPDVSLLAERFRRRGHATGAVVTHDLVGRPHGFERGFDFFDDELAARHHQEHTSEEVADRAVAWLESTRTPFFLLLHFFHKVCPGVL